MDRFLVRSPATSRGSGGISGGLDGNETEEDDEMDISWEDGDVTDIRGLFRRPLPSTQALLDGEGEDGDGENGEGYGYGNDHNGDGGESAPATQPPSEARGDARNAPEKEDEGDGSVASTVRSMRGTKSKEKDEAEKEVDGLFELLDAGDARRRKGSIGGDDDADRRTAASAGDETQPTDNTSDVRARLVRFSESAISCGAPTVAGSRNRQRRRERAQAREAGTGPSHSGGKKTAFQELLRRAAATEGRGRTRKRRRSATEMGTATATKESEGVGREKESNKAVEEKSGGETKKGSRDGQGIGVEADEGGDGDDGGVEAMLKEIEEDLEMTKRRPRPRPATRPDPRGQVDADGEEEGYGWGSGTEAAQAMPLTDSDRTVDGAVVELKRNGESGGNGGAGVVRASPPTAGQDSPPSLRSITTPNAGASLAQRYGGSGGGGNNGNINQLGDGTVSPGGRPFVVQRIQGALSSLSSPYRKDGSRTSLSRCRSGPGQLSVGMVGKSTSQSNSCFDDLLYQKSSNYVRASAGARVAENQWGSGCAVASRSDCGMIPAVGSTFAERCLTRGEGPSSAAVEAAKPISEGRRTIATTATAAAVSIAIVAPVPLTAATGVVVPAASAVPTDNDDDPYGTIDFGEDDLAAMDSLVRQSSGRSDSLPVSVGFGLGGDSFSPAQNPVLSSSLTAGGSGGKLRLLPSAVQWVKDKKEADPPRLSSPPAVPAPSDDGDDPFGDMDLFDDDALAVVDQLVSSAGTGRGRSGSSSSPSTDPNGSLPPHPELPVWNRRLVPGGRGPTFLSFTRYTVLEIMDDGVTYTKTAVMSLWNPETAAATIAAAGAGESRDRWQDLIDPVVPEDIISQGGGLAKKKVDGCIHLRGEWYHTPLTAGDVVHLASISGRYVTSVECLPVVLHTNPPPGSDLDDDLVLVVHPDVLVTPTTISETVGCTRRAVLKGRLGSSGLSSKSAVVGTMRHDLFESCMSSQNFASDFTARNVARIVRDRAESLIGCSVHDDAEVRLELLRTLPRIQMFAKEYTSFLSEGMTNGMHTHGNKLEGHGMQSDIRFSARSVHQTEEEAVTPELGLKGNVDVTVAATAEVYSKHPGINPGPQRPLLMGMELKTGHSQRPHSAHMAQLALYTVMLRVRHGTAAVDAGVVPASVTSPGCPEDAGSRATAVNDGASAGGVLLYLNREGHRALHVAPAAGEIKSLLGQRNAVASDLRRAARPRGIALSYESSEVGPLEGYRGGAMIGGGGDNGGGRERTRKSITVLPATPADLPEVLPMSHECVTCFSNRECMTYAAIDADRGVTKSHASLLRHFTGHMSKEELQYLRDWDRLIDLEALASNNQMAKAWLVPSVERERSTGRCMSEMLVDEASLSVGDMAQPEEDAEMSHDERISILLCFRRSPDAVHRTPLTNLRVELGSNVVVSTDATIFSNGCAPQPRGFYGKGRFRHQVHLFRGSLDKLYDDSVQVRMQRKDLRRVRDLLESYRGHFSSADGSTSGQIASVGLKFRLDKDEISSGIGTLRQNLINFFTKDIVPFSTRKGPALGPDGNRGDNTKLKQRMHWLRQAVIHLDLQPRFDPSLEKSMFVAPSPRVQIIPGCGYDDLASEFSQLNPDQRAAVEKVISAKDYTIIQGLPGTGKTSTIAFVARLLVSHGKRVLITSYTHAAVDNLLVKLIESGMNGSRNRVDLLRIGRKSSCHVDVHSILASEVALEREREMAEADRNVYSNQSNSCAREKPTAQALYNVISRARIIGVSALTVPRTALLVGQHFDTVIVDEAGQMNQPATLGVLMAADSFVLVGDHMQLPPLVANEAAQEAGYGISMLKRLVDKFPSCISQLTLQYRMHEEICLLCNEIVYKGTLKCANENVRSSKLALKRYPNAVPLPSSNTVTITDKGWLQRVLDPNRPVVFMDTDKIGGEENGKEDDRCMNVSLMGDDNKPQSSFKGLEHTRGRNGGGNIVNETEATIVRGIIRGLLKCGLNVASIGVICPYRSQLRLIDEDPFLTRMKRAGLEASTIDRYQGRDKSVIILSMVRSNKKGKSGRLLDDFRRLNVAFSRAKRKLIIVGSFSTLSSGSAVLRPVLETIRQKGWIEHLPSNALPMYNSFMN